MVMRTRSRSRQPIFTFQDVAEQTEKVVFRLLNQRFGLEVKIIYSLGAADFYARKWLEIRSIAGAPVFLEQVAVEKLGLPGESTRLGGFGQPVYAGNLFLGLEYPAGYNTAQELWYYAGQISDEQTFRTEAAVLGVAADGAVREAFLDYISRIRSGAVRPVIVFNTWYDMQRDTLNERNCLERLRLLKEKLLDPYGIRLASFVLDDGWDDRNSVWEVHARRFPGGPGALTDALRQAGAGLGLWFGPIGGYDQRELRIAAGRKLGYEITANGQYFCLAGSQYREKFKSTVLEMVRRYSVNHLKFDGVPYGCNAPNHGHAVGVYSREAHVRAFVDLLRAVRAADPGVFLNITTSNWLSPWWLRYADVVFMGGMDYGFLNNVPAVSERDKAITYRDAVLYDDYRKHEYQFPNSSLMTIGIIKGTLGAEGGQGESEQSWVRNAIMNFSRGSMLTELYISPAVLSSGEWRALGSVIRWADRRKDVLLYDTRLVLGDPSQREVYAYAHFSGQGIVTLRNPSIEEQTVTLSLNRELGLTPDSVPLRARVIYPYRDLLPATLRFGDSVRFAVRGFEVLVIEFVPPGSVTEEGPRKERSTWKPDFEYGFSNGRGTMTIALPSRTENRCLALLYEAEAGTSSVGLKFADNGRHVEARIVSPGSTEKGLGQGAGQWVFYIVPLAEGSNRIEFTGAPPEGKLRAWALADFPSSTAGTDSDGQLPLPGFDSQVVHLFTTGERRSR
jgi:hypothetical protein